MSEHQMIKLPKEDTHICQWQQNHACLLYKPKLLKEDIYLENDFRTVEARQICSHIVYFVQQIA